MQQHEKPSDAKLENVFRHHPPKNGQAARYEMVRECILKTAKACRDLTPASPEQTRALNKLQEAMFLFNASIALNE